MLSKIKSTKGIRVFIAILVLASFLFPNLLTTKILAASNSTMSVQGKIVNKTTGTNVVNGSPSCVNAGGDTCDIQVSIYDSNVAGTLLWRETWTNIELGTNGGIFSLNLNSICGNWSSPGGSCSGSGITGSNGWGSGNKYIEITFDPTGASSFTETFGRVLLTTVPYAYYADVSGTLADLSDNSSTAFRLKEANNNYISVDTTNSTEVLAFGNATTNPLFSFLGSGFVRINSLSASSAVYTDASKNLTTTAPTSGTIGYWTRTGTTLSQSTSNDLLSLTYSATGTTTSNLKLLNSASSGTFNTTSSVLTNYAAYFSNTSTRATGSNALTNVGLYATASGAQNNYAAIFENGNVGIGTTAPAATFQVGSTYNMQFSATDGVLNITGSNPGAGTLILNNSDAAISFSGAQVLSRTGGSVQIMNAGTGGISIRNQTLYNSGGPSFNLAGTDTGAITIKTVYDTNTRVKFEPMVANGASALAYLFDTDNSLSTAGAKLFEIREAGSARFTVDHAGNVGIGNSSPSALLHIGAATASYASLRLESSAGTNPSSPGSGDLWWNGTNLNFRTSSGTIDLLSATGGTYIAIAPVSAQTTGNTSNAIININENGTGTPDLINLATGGSSIFRVNNSGQLYVNESGVNASIVLGSQSNNTLGTSIGAGAPSSSLFWGDLKVCIESGNGCPTGTDFDMVNKSGSTLTAGTLVVLDSTNENSFTTTTTANNDKVIGVLQTASCANSATCSVRVSGVVNNVTVTNITAVGEYLYTSTTAGQAKRSTSSTDAGVIGIALTSDSSAPYSVKMLITKELGNSGGIYTNSATVANGSYIDVTHNQNTSSVISNGWINLNSKWLSISSVANGLQTTDVTISSTVNIDSTIIASGRTYADGIAYRVDPASISGASVSRYTTSYSLSNGIAPGDEVLLINLMGSSTDNVDVGNYEIFTVSSVTASTITFNTNISKSYDGTSAANQYVVIQRIPTYSSITVTATGVLTTSAWDGLATAPTGTAGFRTGILAFKANTTTIATGGSITTTGKGFRGGVVAEGKGESYGGGLGTSGGTRNLGGGGGGTNAVPGAQGGGGAYTTDGGTGTGGVTQGGMSYYQSGKVYLGSGGGSCFAGTSPGAPGGGIILIFANILNNSGTIASNGQNGSGGCTGSFTYGVGGGAGGHVVIQTASVVGTTPSSSAVTGGLGSTQTYSGGNGGNGRLDLTTNTPLSNTSAYYIEQLDANTVRLYNNSGTNQSLRLSVAVPTLNTGTAIPWNNNANPTSNLALTMGSYTSTFTYGSSTGLSNLFTLTDSASNTGTGYLMNLQTASGSTLNPFKVNVGGSDKFAVTSGGNVGIGTGNPSSELELSASTDPWMVINSTNSGNGSAGILFREDGANLWNLQALDSNDTFYLLDGDSSHGLYITQNSNSWTAFSDLRLKSNIEEQTDLLSKINQIKTVTYNFKDTETREIGVIAQDLLPIFPEVVSYDGEYYGVSYDRLGAIALGGIKEQYQLFNEQQVQIDEIKDRLDQLGLQLQTPMQTINNETTTIIQSSFFADEGSFISTSKSIKTTASLFAQDVVSDKLIGSGATLELASAFVVKNQPGEVMFSVNSNGKITIKESANSSTGKVTMPLGETRVVVNNTSISEDSRIVVTPNQFVSFKVTDRLVGKSFAIEISQVNDSEVVFDYVVIN